MFHLPFPVYDANASSGAGDLGKLPEWDLTDLYTSDDAPELTRDLDWLAGECAAFASDYEGKLATLDADGLLTCVHRNEKINSIAGRIMSYAGLRYYQLTTDAARAKFLSDMQEKSDRLLNLLEVDRNSGQLDALFVSSLIFLG